MMNNAPVKSLLDRLLETAVLLVLAALLLTWAWSLLRPLLPVLAVGVGLIIAGTLLMRRHRGW